MYPKMIYLFHIIIFFVPAENEIQWIFDRISIFVFIPLCMEEVE